MPEQATVVREICRRIAAGEACEAIANDFNRRGVPAPSQRWTTGQVRRVVALLVDEPDHPIAGEARRRLDAGEEPLAIARDFNARGVPAVMAAWTRYAVHDIALNPRYLGRRTYHGEVTAENAWPAIVDEVTYTRCRAILLDPARKGRKPGLRAHWLTGIAVCGVCGVPVGTLSGPSGIGRTYSCRTPARDGHPGYHVHRRVDLVDAYVEEFLFTLLSRPDFADAFSDDTVAEQVRDAAAQVETLRERLDEHYEEAAAGRLSARALGAVEARLTAEIERLETQMRTLRIPTVARDLAAPTPAEVERAWRTLSLEQRRQVAETLLTIVIRPHGRGRRLPIHETVGITVKTQAK